MTSLKMLSADDKLAEIRRLYFEASKRSIQQDLAKAMDLLKSMASEEERERATVYMEGLAEMLRDWEREPRPGSGKKRGGRPAASGSAKSVPQRGGRGNRKS